MGGEGNKVLGYGVDSRRGKGDRADDFKSSQISQIQMLL